MNDLAAGIPAWGIFLTVTLIAAVSYRQEGLERKRARQERVTKLAIAALNALRARNEKFEDGFHDFLKSIYGNFPQQNLKALICGYYAALYKVYLMRIDKLSSKNVFNILMSIAEFGSLLNNADVPEIIKNTAAHTDRANINAEMRAEYLKAALELVISKIGGLTTTRELYPRRITVYNGVLTGMRRTNT
ncbi:MAG: hypothetical protein LBB61_02820 [Treponema sp.]|jgi:hypothetical protein|nr:hypothetical protein [Treponema sp.]